MLRSTGPRITLLHMRNMRNIKNVEDMHRLVTFVAGQHEIGANDVTRCYKHISFPSSHELRNTPAQKKVKFFCGHGYHLHCINRWSQPWPSRKLPSCRQIDIAHLPSRKPQPFLKEERNSSNTKPLDNSKMSHQQATLTKTQRTLVIRNFSISEESGFPHLSDNFTKPRKGDRREPTEPFIQIISLGQWLNFKLFGITCLVGKIKFKLLFQGSIG